MESIFFHNVFYDSKHDMLDIIFKPSKASYGDEYGHVTLMRDMTNDEITGILIFSPLRKEEKVRKELSDIKDQTGFAIDYKLLKSQCVEAV